MVPKLGGIAPPRIIIVALKEQLCDDVPPQQRHKEMVNREGKLLPSLQLVMLILCDLV